MNQAEQEATCFAITGAFEGRGFGQVTGNFDAQGASLGFLQWPLGVGNAQRLIARIYQLDSSAFVINLGDIKAKELLAVCDAPKHDAVKWADKLSVLPGKRKLVAEWAKPLEKLLTSVAGQQAQREFARPYMEDAENDAKFYHIETLRGLALCFDIAVQNGQGKAGANGRKDVAVAFANRGGHALPYDRKLKALAEAVATTCNPRWAADVLGRKMLIVTGSGKFRGTTWNMAARFGLSDDPLA